MILTNEILYELEWVFILEDAIKAWYTFFNLSLMTY